MLKLVLIINSYKKILAHSIDTNKVKLKKGKILSREDINLLKDGGLEKIYIFDKSPHQIDENEASFRLSKFIISNNIRINKPVNGRTDLFAKKNGLLIYNKKLLYKLNYYNDELAIAMMKTEEVVQKNQLIGNIKILPYAINETILDKILNENNYLNFIQVKKAKIRNIALIISSDQENIKSNSKIINSINLRLSKFDLKIKYILYCKHNDNNIKNNLLSEKIKDSELILLYGSTSIVDKNDIIPKALKKAKGKVISYGAPTDPGNLLMYGTLQNKKIIGVPGCAKSILRNGFDLVLEKACFNFKINKKVIAELSYGGLFKNIIRKN